jgi:hypothetical protein
MDLVPLSRFLTVLSYWGLLYVAILYLPLLMGMAVLSLHGIVSFFQGTQWNTETPKHEIQW